MADKDRPDRIPRPSSREMPKTLEQEGQEFTATKIARFGSDAKCSTCFHCYSIRLEATHIEKSLVCYWGPPAHALVPVDNRGGMAVRHLHRIVGAEFFCHQWRTRD